MVKEELSKLKNKNVQLMTSKSSGNLTLSTRKDSIVQKSQKSTNGKRIDDPKPKHPKLTKVYS